MARRSRAREIALQLLYEGEFHDGGDDARLREFVRNRLGAASELFDFAWSLFDGVRQRRETIDGLLKKWSERWDVSRMAVVDRNILRLGTFEIVWFGTPKPVAVNEAILLAKRYGNQQSFQFVNAILDRMSPGLAAESTTPADDTP